MNVISYIITHFPLAEQISPRIDTTSCDANEAI